MKQFFLEFVVFFAITFVSSVVVSFFYSYFTDGAGTFDWAIAFRSALLFALVFPVIDLFNARKKKK